MKNDLYPDMPIELMIACPGELIGKIDVQKVYSDVDIQNFVNKILLEFSKEDLEQLSAVLNAYFERSKL